MLEQILYLSIWVIGLAGILLFFNVSFKALTIMIALITGFIGVPLLMMGGSWYSLLVTVESIAFVAVPWTLAELIRRLVAKFARGKPRLVEGGEADAHHVTCPACGTELEASRECIGRKVQCAECGAKWITDGVNEYSSGSNPQETGQEYHGNVFHLLHVGGIPAATSILVAVNVAVSIFLYFRTGSIMPDVRAYVQYGANFRPLTVGGQWWRIATSAFLHFGLIHLLINVLCLFSIGRTLEKLVGNINIIVAYFFASLVGGLFSCIFHADEVCAGASSAVFGFFGTEVSYVLQMRKEYNLTSRETIDYIKSSLAFVVINLIYSLKPGIDMAAHIGGFLAGLAFGTILAISRKRGDTAFRQVSLRLAFTAICLSIILAATMYTGRNAKRMSIEELKQEVSALFVEKVTEAVKPYGNIAIEITSFALKHSDRDKYFGQIEGLMTYNDINEPFASSIDVGYDGENILYELKNIDVVSNCIDRIGKRLVIPQLCQEVKDLFSTQMINAIQNEGAGDVSVTVKSLSLIYDGGDSYHGKIEAEVRYDGETENISSCIRVTFDGENIAFELTEVK